MSAFSYKMDGKPILYYQVAGNNISSYYQKCTNVIQEDAILLQLEIPLDESKYQDVPQRTTLYTFASGAYLFAKSGLYSGTHSCRLYCHNTMGYEYNILGCSISGYDDTQMNILRNVSTHPTFVIAPYYMDKKVYPIEDPDDTYNTYIGYWAGMDIILDGYGPNYINYNLSGLFPDVTYFKGFYTDLSYDNLDDFNVEDLTMNPYIPNSLGNQSSYKKFSWQIFYEREDITASHTQYNQLLFDMITPGGTFIDPSDPLDDGGNSESDTSIGGNGTYDYTSDVITPPALPSLTATESGFVYVYNPTQSQLQQISNYCWSTDLVINALTTVFGSPIQGIISLHTIPSSIPNVVSTNFAIAGIVTTDIQVNVPSSQYVTVDCGTLDVTPFTGTFLDYSPHTKVQLYLPYLGYRDISADEIMGKTIAIKYVIDIVNGSFVCFIQANGILLYQFNGTCSMSIPMTSVDYSQYLTTAMNMAGSIATGYVAGGQAAKAIPSETSVGESAEAIARRQNTKINVASGSIANTAGSITSAKPNISRSGNFSGSAGIMAYQKPYFIFTTPKQSKPSKQKKLYGYPCNMAKKLGDLTGYTKVSNIKLESINCTVNEKSEIMSLLQGGVFI